MDKMFIFIVVSWFIGVFFVKKLMETDEKLDTASDYLVALTCYSFYPIMIYVMLINKWKDVNRKWKEHSKTKQKEKEEPRLRAIEMIKLIREQIQPNESFRKQTFYKEQSELLLLGLVKLENVKLANDWSVKEEWKIASILSILEASNSFSTQQKKQLFDELEGILEDMSHTWFEVVKKKKETTFKELMGQVQTEKKIHSQGGN